MLEKLLGRNRIDTDTLFALEWKKPDRLEVFIKKTEDGCYFAKVTSLDGNVVTQANDGMSLVEMVNDAVYDYLDIPAQYRAELGYFMPPASVREEFKLGIPRSYLNRTIGLERA